MFESINTPIREKNLVQCAFTEVRGHQEVRGSHWMRDHRGHLPCLRHTMARLLQGIRGQKRAGMSQTCRKEITKKTSHISILKTWLAVFVLCVYSEFGAFKPRDWGHFREATARRANVNISWFVEFRRVRDEGPKVKRRYVYLLNCIYYSWAQEQGTMSEQPYSWSGK